MADPPEHDEDIIPLAPIDEADEQRRAEHLRELRELEAPLRAESEHQPPVPLEHREDLCPADLEHFVVNYCLDSHHLHRERLGIHVRELRRFGELGREAVYNFLEGRSTEPALREIDADDLKHFLNKLLEQLGA
jgi:hypothetical protein